MLVSMWMTRDVFVIPPTMTIAEAAGEMAQRRVRRLPVVAPAVGGMHLLGIVSLLDLARAFPSGINPLSLQAVDQGPQEPVSSIMTREPTTIAPDAPLEAAARILVDRKIGTLPVVQAGRLVGIITESDIFRALVEAIGGTGRGVRVTFDLSAGEDIMGVVGDAASRHDMRVTTILTVEHDGSHIGVVRMQGPGSDAFVDELWRSGRHVISVLRTDTAPGR